MPSSGYIADSFVAGEQPTTSKWNELWGNDASFNNGNGFNDSIILPRHMSAQSVGPTALNLAPQTAYVAASEATSSTTYTDLTTVGPTVTVTIGGNGLALVILSCNKMFNTTTAESHMGFAVSGANTQAAADSYSYMLEASTTNLPQTGGSGVFLLTGLTSGNTTFTAKYRASGGSAQCQDRRIAVIPL